MRREPEFFGDEELVLIYAAKRLKEALALEGVLDRDNIDYAVVADTYTGGFIFRSQRVGAYFYLAPRFAEQARALMKQRGYKPIEEP